MSKLIRVKQGCNTADYSADDFVLVSLASPEFDRSDSDVRDQAQRIDATREALARLVGELYDAGVLDLPALARIAVVDQWQVSEVEPPL